MEHTYFKLFWGVFSVTGNPVPLPFHVLLFWNIIVSVRSGNKIGHHRASSGHITYEFINKQLTNKT